MIVLGDQPDPFIIVCLINIFNLSNRAEGDFSVTVTLFLSFCYFELLQRYEIISLLNNNRLTLRGNLLG